MYALAMNNNESGVIPISGIRAWLFAITPACCITVLAFCVLRQSASRMHFSCQCIHCVRYISLKPTRCPNSSLHLWLFVFHLPLRAAEFIPLQFQGFNPNPTRSLVMSIILRGT